MVAAAPLRRGLRSRALRACRSPFSVLNLRGMVDQVPVPPKTMWVCQGTAMVSSTIQSCMPKYLWGSPANIAWTICVLRELSEVVRLQQLTQEPDQRASISTRTGDDDVIHMYAQHHLDLPGVELAPRSEDALIFQKLIENISFIFDIKFLLKALVL